MATTKRRPDIKPNQTSVSGVLKVKLGVSLTGPTRKMHAELAGMLRDARRIRNEMAWAFRQWHRDNPGWSPPQAMIGKGENRKPWFINRTVAGVRRQVPVPENLPMPKEITPEMSGGIIPADATGRSFLTFLYWAGVKAVPDRPAFLYGQCSKEVNKELTSAFAGEGEAYWRWQAVLTGERQVSDYEKCRTIPMPRSGGMTIAMPASSLGDLTTMAGAGVRFGPNGLDLREAGRHHCILSFPTGNSRRAVCRLRVRRLSDGNRKLFRRIIAGTDGFSLADSQLVCRDGEWWLHVCYEQPVQAKHLDPKREAKIVPCFGQATNPFEAITVGEKPWRLGNVRPMLADALRVRARAATLRGRVQRGHGRPAFMLPIRKASRRLTNLAEAFVRDMATEAAEYAVRSGCGTLVYWEPHPKTRDHLWPSARRIDFDWTQFGNRLQRACALRGVRLEVVRVNAAQIRAGSATSRPPESAARGRRLT
jgi:hypothetical protein